MRTFANARTTVAALLVGLVLAACGGTSETTNDLPSTGDAPSAALEQTDSDAEATSDAETDDREIPQEAPASAGSGQATVQVGDLVFAAEQLVCFSDPGFFQFEGSGTDGSIQAWVSVSGDVNEDYDGDGDADVTATVSVEVGKTDAYTSAPDGQPRLQADVIEFSGTAAVVDLPFEFTIDGDSMSGTGEIQDYSGVMFDFGESAPLSFSATCS